MATISLTDIAAAVERKYADLVIELPDGDVHLRPALRLPKKDRDRLSELQKANAADAEAGDLDALDYFKQFVTVVAATPASAKKLLEAAGDDLAVLGEIISNYAEATQPGEASTSES